MLTLLLYVLIVGLVAALLFLVVSALFGRSEELGPLPEGTTATVLPAEGISGADVRALRFQQVVRGYKAGEVDWALTRLAARIDELETQLAHARSGDEVAATPLAYSATNGMAVPAEPPAPRRVTADPDADGAAPLPEVLPSPPDQPLPGATSQPGTLDHSGIPSQPGAPDHSGTPSQPGTRDHSGIPSQPSAPDHSGTPSQPSTPNHSGTPSQPSAPDHSGIPSQPGTPDRSGIPSQPGPPGVSGMPIHPGTPGRPGTEPGAL